MKKVLAFLLGIWILSSCSSSSDGSTEKSSSQYLIDSIYRPAFHFSPKKNWMGNPVSLVLHNETYHLFFEYNSDGASSKNNSWGHATSTDMLSWNEQQPILENDNQQGSVVSDVNNTSGFGTNSLIAIYSEDDEVSLSFSTDNGINWSEYSETLLDISGIPKVSWYASNSQWIMTLSDNSKVTFFSSDDLISWSQESELELEGNLLSAELFSVDDQWGLLINGESKVEYLLGAFDGSAFTSNKNPLLFDLGRDNTSGTILKTPDRSVFISWMNNEAYASDLPTKSWKSAMTLPRELRLSENRLMSYPIDEVKTILSAKRRGKLDLLKTSTVHWYNFTIQDVSEDVEIMLANSESDKFKFGWDASLSTFSIDRSSYGLTNTEFDKVITGSYSTLSSPSTFDIFIDRSSIEIFVNNGEASFTTLVFPKAAYTNISLAVDGERRNTPAVLYDVETVMY